MSAVRAADGSIQDLKELTDYMNSGNRSPTRLQILPVCLTHLDPSKIPSSPSTNATEKILLAELSLKGLGCLIADHLSGSEVFSISLLSLWPIIWKWMLFLHTLPLSKLKLNMDAGYETEISRINLYILYGLADQEGFRGIINSSPEALAMIIQIWARVVTHESFRGISCAQMSKVLSAFASPLVTQSKTYHLDEVVGAAGGTTEVTSLAIEQLRLLQGPAPDYVFFCSGMRVIMQLFQSSPKIHHALLSPHCLAALINALRVLNSSSRDADAIQTSLSLCYAFVALYLDSTDGFTWVIRALEDQLLPTILKSAPLLLDGRVKYCKLILTNVLPGYLIYHSVLRAVARSLKSIESLGLDAHVCPGSSELLFPWAKFKRYAQDRLDIKAYHDQMGSRSKCDNLEVSLPTIYTVIWRCCV